MWYFTASTRVRNTVVPQSSRVISVGAPSQSLMPNTTPPSTHAIAYISLRNISGSSFMSTSRITPPAAPVMAPMIMATHIVMPQSSDFCRPTMVNSARPMASKMKKVLCICTRLLRKIITHSKASAVQLRYMPLCIQNTGWSSITSRSVPPPMAVAAPTTYAPNQSNLLADARRIPLMAKANVPMKSII